MSFSHDLSSIEEELNASDRYWKSFVEKENFELGVLVLEPGEVDTQSPHKSDEVYFIIEGNGFMNIEGVDYEIKPKTAIYIPQDVSHKIHNHTKRVVAYYALN